MPSTAHHNLWSCFCFNFLDTSLRYFLQQGLKERHFPGEAKGEEKKSWYFISVIICHLFMPRWISCSSQTQWHLMGKDWRWLIFHRLRLGSGASTPQQVQGSHCTLESKENHIFHHLGCVSNLCPSLRVSLFPRCCSPPIDLQQNYRSFWFFPAGEDTNLTYLNPPFYLGTHF